MIAPKPPIGKRIYSVPRIDPTRRERGRVTIAAAFRFTGGVLLCADTEISSGRIKYDDTKILAHDFTNLGSKLVFAMAGSVPYAHRAIRRINDRLMSLPDQEISENALVDAIEEVLVAEFEKLRKHPNFGYEDGPYFYLLVAIWTRKGGLALYSSFDDCLMPFTSGMGFIGRGDYFARYVADTSYCDDISIVDVIPLATYVLKQTKANVPGCGGFSQLILISGQDGESGPLDYKSIQELEEFSEPFYRGIHALYFGLVSDTWDQKRITSEFATFKEWLLDTRKKVLAERKRREQVEQKLIAEFLKKNPKLSIAQTSEDQR